MKLSRTTNRVRIRKNLSDGFEEKQGLRQGDLLSLFLFNLVLAQVIREAKINRTGLVFHKKYQCLPFADDIVVTRTVQELKEKVKVIEETSKNEPLTRLIF